MAGHTGAHGLGYGIDAATHQAIWLEDEPAYATRTRAWWEGV